VFGETDTVNSRTLLPTTPEFVFFENSYKAATPTPRYGFAQQPFFVVGSNTDPGGFFGSDETDSLVAYDQAGNYIGVFSKFSGSDNPIDGIGGVVLAATGNILVSSQNSDQVLEFDGLTGQYIGVFGDASTPGSGLDFPAGLTVGPDNNIYVSSLDTERILKFDGSDGNLLGVVARGNTTDALIERFTDLAFGPDGNLYVGFNPEIGNSGAGLAQVREYNPETGELLDTITGIDFAAALDFGPDGLLYVSDDPQSILDANFMPVFPDTPGQIQVYDVTGQLSGQAGPQLVRSFDVGVANAGAVSFGTDGNLYLSNPGSGTVTIYNPQSGQALGSLEVPALTGELGRPTGSDFFASVHFQSPILSVV
jgi:sugar lactone lactonase YvrE